MLATSIAFSGYANAPNKADLRHYFEYSNQGIEPLEDGLREVPFGEYLVERGVIDRFQLFRALQLQDQTSGIRFGEAVVALGYASSEEIEGLVRGFSGVDTIDVD